jgi:hypothetical protein
MAMLGPNPTQERFRLTAYYLTDLAFQASGAEPLTWGEFMEQYTTMYPHGQPGLPDDPVMAYVNDLRATCVTSGPATARRAPSTWPPDPTCECFVCVVSASSSSARPGASATPPMPNVGRASTSSRRLGVSSTRSWLTSTESSGRTPSPATSSPLRCRPRSWSRCRSNTMREMASGRSAVLLLSNPEPAPRRRRLEDAHATTIGAPMKARKSMSTPMVMPRRSLGGRRRT